MSKKINSTSFVPGRIYSVIYSSLVEMVQTREFSFEQVRGHAGLKAAFMAEQPVLAAMLYTAPDASVVKLSNPLVDCEVTVRRVSSVQAAGNKTWRNFQLKRNPEYKPDAEHKSWYHVTLENSCIVAHNKSNEHYLRALPKGISKEEYFIGGKPANETEVSLIRCFKKSNGREAEFSTLKLSNLENVIDSGGENE
jgi:hypothetical protein